ncbi:hypothetical protein M7I_7802 [Glarea lozoyensis 74030]|uniref:Uncharacterized protein n=1 Tax=Glarea lozoyensis (strain ATCC 74030 / MF5533) TaxID=1104152 RepID=H0EYA3_GLAL7|nr:hypothetical protein M7I_7802 [Glarea lozoyensis 74030]
MSTTLSAAMSPVTMMLPLGSLKFSVQCWVASSNCFA